MQLILIKNFRVIWNLKICFLNLEAVKIHFWKTISVSFTVFFCSIICTMPLHACKGKIWVQKIFHIFDRKMACCWSGFECEPSGWTCQQKLCCTSDIRTDVLLNKTRSGLKTLKRYNKNGLKNLNTKPSLDGWVC